MERKNEKIKYFLYARKSTEAEDKQVASIDSQIAEINKIAKRNRINIIGVFKETQSAKSPGRPVFNEMIERIQKGEAGGVLCWKLNRLARNSVDGGAIQWMLRERIIKHIQTHNRGYSPEDNAVIMSVEFGMADQYSRDLSTDTKRGLLTKAERGWYPTFSTLGYMHNPIKIKGKKEIIRDPERFDLVRKAFNLVLSGQHTPPQALKIATDKWNLRNKHGKKVSRSTIYRIMNDTFYYGIYEYPKGSGNWHKGKHEAMITEEEFNKIQALVHRKDIPRPKKKEFAFRGPLRCGECGAMITAYSKIKRQKNGNVHHYTFYSCTKRKDPNCTQKVVEEKNLERQIVNLLKRIRIPNDFVKWAFEVIREENKQEAKGRDLISATQKKTHTDCIKKLDNLIDMRASEEIDSEEFAKKKSELMKEKLHLEELINDTNKRTDDWINNAETFFNFAANAKKRFEEGTLDVKKSILTALGSNLLIKDKKLLIQTQKPLLLAEEVVPEANKLMKRLEPLNQRKRKQFKNMFNSSFVILPLLEAFRTINWQSLSHELKQLSNLPQSQKLGLT